MLALGQDPDRLLHQHSRGQGVLELTDRQPELFDLGELTKVWPGRPPAGVQPAAIRSARTIALVRSQGALSSPAAGPATGQPPGVGE